MTNWGKVGFPHAAALSEGLGVDGRRPGDEDQAEWWEARGGVGWNRNATYSTQCP